MKDARVKLCISMSPLGSGRVRPDTVGFVSGVELGAGLKSAGGAGKAVVPIAAWLRDRWGSPLRITKRPVRDRGVWFLGTMSVLTARDLADLPSSAPQVVRGWLEVSHAATEVGERRLDLLLDSASSREVAIESCDVLVEKRETSKFGALVKSPNAGAVETTYLGVDLADGADPTPVVVRQDLRTEWTDELFFPGRRILLSPGESHAVALLSRTGQDTVWWRLRFTYRVRRRTRELFYPGPDEPALVTSGITDAEQYWGAGVEGLQHPPFLSHLARSRFVNS